jgi:hypothetical protein
MICDHLIGQNVNEEAVLSQNLPGRTENTFEERWSGQPKSGPKSETGNFRIGSKNVNHFIVKWGMNMKMMIMKTEYL